MNTTLNYFVSFLIVASSIVIAYREYKIQNRIVNVLSLFSIGFLLPFGISFLKLSKLSSDYDIRTIILVFGSFLSFYIGVKEGVKVFSINKRNKEEANKKISIKETYIIYFLFIVTFVSFLIEVMILRFIPLFSLGTPHAYSTFHIFGIHYITTLFFMIPAFSVLNYKNKKDLKLLILSIIYAVIMSLLLVSRALLIMTVFVTVISYILKLNIEKNKKNTFNEYIKNNKFAIIIGGISFIFLYVLITIFRSHSIKYLNDIFEMKENTPIFITQPYMYLTQGFENLNYLITHNDRLTFGRRTLAPIFSLLRTKVYFPLVTESPFYQIKLELTSKPIIYDLYYDFSFIGTSVIMFFLGVTTKIAENKAYKEKNIYYIMFFSLISYYLLFSFFQSYLSMLDVWFYLVFTYLLYVLSKSNIKISKIIKHKK